MASEKKCRTCGRYITLSQLRFRGGELVQIEAERCGQMTGGKLTFTPTTADSTCGKWIPRGPSRTGGGQIRQKKTINDIIMDSLEERLKIIMDAATNLVEQVENYTTKAGSRFLLLDAKDRLKKALEKRAP